MIISKAVYGWLVDNKVLLPSSVRKASQEHVTLSVRTTNQLLNGSLILDLMNTIASTYGMRKVDPKTLSDDKDSQAVAAYNWSALSDVLDRFGIDIDQELLQMILGGDTDILVEFLDDLYIQQQMGNLKPVEKKGQAVGRVESSPEEGEEAGGGGSSSSSPLLAFAFSSMSPVGSTGTMTPSPSPSSRHSGEALEHVARLLAGSLDIPEEQAMALVTTDVPNLQKILIYGLKKSKYTLVNGFLYATFQKVAELGTLLVEEPGGIGEVLSVLQSAFLSRNPEVALWACRIFARLGHQFVHEGSERAQSAAYRWLVSASGGIPSILICVRRHLDTKLALVPVIETFASGNFVRLFARHLPAAFRQPCDFLVFVNELIEPLADSKPARSELAQEGALEVLVEYGIKYAGSAYGDETRVAALMLLSDLWAVFRVAVQEDAHVVLSIFEALKSGSRARSETLQLTTLACLFHLLHTFAPLADSYAPFLFKFLIFAMVEQRGQPAVSDYVRSNFALLLEQQAVLPVKLLVGPVVAALDKGGVDALDCDVLLAMAKHPTMSEELAGEMVEGVAGHAVSDAWHGRLVAMVLVLLADRFPVYGERLVRLGVCVHEELRWRMERGGWEEDGVRVKQVLALELVARLVGGANERAVGYVRFAAREGAGGFRAILEMHGLGLEGQSVDYRSVERDAIVDRVVGGGGGGVRLPNIVDKDIEEAARRGEELRARKAREEEEAREKERVAMEEVRARNARMRKEKERKERGSPRKGYSAYSGEKRGKGVTREYRKVYGMVRGLVVDEVLHEVMLEVGRREWKRRGKSRKAVAVGGGGVSAKKGSARVARMVKGLVVDEIVHRAMMEVGKKEFERVREAGRRQRMQLERERQERAREERKREEEKPVAEEVQVKKEKKRRKKKVVATAVEESEFLPSKGSNLNREHRRVVRMVKGLVMDDIVHRAMMEAGKREFERVREAGRKERERVEREREERKREEEGKQAVEEETVKKEKKRRKKKSKEEDGSGNTGNNSSREVVVPGKRSVHNQEHRRAVRMVKKEIVEGLLVHRAMMAIGKR